MEMRLSRLLPATHDYTAWQKGGLSACEARDQAIATNYRNRNLSHLVDLDLVYEDANCLWLAVPYRSYAHPFVALFVSRDHPDFASLPLGRY